MVFTFRNGVVLGFELSGACGRFSDSGRIWAFPRSPSQSGVS